MDKTFSIPKFNKVVSKATENMSETAKANIRAIMLYKSLIHANKIGAK